MNPTPAPGNQKEITVPRDPDVETAESSRRDLTPSPDTVNMPDEGYSSADKPLQPDSEAARRLQEHPPQARGELETGSGGDAARPGKTGVANTTLPPRGQAR